MATLAFASATLFLIAFFSSWDHALAAISGISPTSYIFSNISASIRPTGNCSVPGICTPVNVSIPASTAWVWCGFPNTHRTYYSFKSSSNFSSFWILREQLDICMIYNVSNATNCNQLPDSTCRRVTSCTNRTFGYTFYREMCAVVVNTNARRAVFSVKAESVADGPRNLGTSFSLLIIILWTFYTIMNITCGVYSAAKTPLKKPQHDKPHHEKLLPKADIEVPTPGEDAPAKQTLGQRVASILHLKNKHSAQPA